MLSARYAYQRGLLLGLGNKGWLDMWSVITGLAAGWVLQAGGRQ